MRYYSFVINTNSEQIKANSKVKLNNYCYDNDIAAVNSFVQKNTSNDMSFFIYKEDGDICYAAFSFNEQKHTLQYVYDTICDLMKTNFDAKACQAAPDEITMHQFQEMFLEGKRHENVQGSVARVVDSSRLWTYYLNPDEEKTLPFTMEELIASEDVPVLDIYDKSFSDELVNITEHRLSACDNVNLIHYIISGNSRQAEFQLANALVGTLVNSNRLSSRRIVYLSDLSPKIYSKNHYFETIIENNYGGTVVIDLTEKFGDSASEYLTACRYLNNLFKKHCNKCLFIFTYDINATGYSYYLLPEIRKFVLTLPLKEGEGNRRAASAYLKTLIRNSEYAKFVKHTNEYMKLFEGSHFSQTDVLDAFEKFGPWCMNKMLNDIYDFDISDEFSLDRENDAESASKLLDGLIGLDIVKKQIASIIASDIVEKERRKHGDDYQSISSHMIFAGNPGSAKTTVAKLFAGIAKQKNILKSGVFVERSGTDLNGPFCVPAIREAFIAARGGVLFIDEAYAIELRDAVTTLLQEIENQRDNVIVILAGYSDRMHAFLERNEGLKSRIPHWVDFPDYSTAELTEIFKYMMDRRGMKADDDAIKSASQIFDRVRILENFGNGRYVRNLIDRAVLNQSSRLMSSYECADSIPTSELYRITADDISSLHEGLKEAREPGAAKKELDSMIGLTSAKEVINKAIAKFKLDKMCMDKGIPRTRGAMHMVFTGNPGTAKTTVARLCAEILSDEKILSTGSFVEVGRADLVGDHVGATARIVKKKFREAQGGVLFIDEAYSLCDHYEGSFGDEAINTIVQEMENHREDVVVIFAGYPQPMKDFLERNPGMRSRIAFYVDFEDYSTDELCQITQLMLSRKQMSITDQAMDKLRSNYDSARVNNDYGNGRYVRKLLEEAEMNQARRIIGLPLDEQTTEVITTIDASDIPEFTTTKKTTYRMGFAS